MVDHTRWNHFFVHASPGRFFEVSQQESLRFGRQNFRFFFSRRSETGASISVLDSFSGALDGSPIGIRGFGPAHSRRGLAPFRFNSVFRFDPNASSRWRGPRCSSVSSWKAVAGAASLRPGQQGNGGMSECQGRLGHKWKGTYGFPWHSSPGQRGRGRREPDPNPNGGGIEPRSHFRSLLAGRAPEQRKEIRFQGNFRFFVCSF